MGQIIQNNNLYSIDNKDSRFHIINGQIKKKNSLLNILFPYFTYLSLEKKIGNSRTQRRHYYYQKKSWKVKKSDEAS